MQLYYITDGSAFPGDETARRRRLLDKIAEAARASVDYIQLRERDLSSAQLEELVLAAVQTIGEIQGNSRAPKPRTRLLINSRTDIALSAGADGVHLRSDDISPREVRAILSSLPARDFTISVACHSVADVRNAVSEGATLAVLAPIFGKLGSAFALGLDALSEAAKMSVPVFALGGVSVENARSCREAGAAGIAAIRLFQENDIAAIARSVRTNGTH